MTIEVRIVGNTAAELRGLLAEALGGFLAPGEPLNPLEGAHEADAAPAASAEPARRTRRTKEQIAADEAAAKAAKEAEANSEAAKLAVVMGADAKVVAPKPGAKAAAEPEPEGVEEPGGDPLAEEGAEEATDDGNEGQGAPLTYAEVSDVCMDVRRHPKLGVPDLIALCKPFGIKKLAELKEDDYRRLYDAAQALLKKAGPAA